MKFSTLKTTGKSLIAVLALSLAVVLNANAQRIAYVDVNEILESIVEYQEAQKQLDEVASRWRQEIANEYDNIKSMYNRYQTEQVLLSDDARKQKKKKLLRKKKMYVNYNVLDLDQRAPYLKSVKN